MPNDLRIDPSVFNAVKAIRRGEDEQVRIERTLGQALLSKMQGKAVSLLEVYQGLGGGDPVVQTMLDGDLGTAFKDLPVQPGIRAARELTLSDRVGAAAAAKNSALERNTLTQLEGQALNTLAGLGGAEFVAKYKLEQ